MNPFHKRTIGRYTSDGQGHHAWMELEPAPDRRKRQPGTILLCCAALLLLGLAAAQGYVSWRAQYGYIFAAKHEHLPSVLEALGLDTGAVIFAFGGATSSAAAMSTVTLLPAVTSTCFLFVTPSPFRV